MTETRDRSLDSSDDPLVPGHDETPGGAGNRPAGPDYGASSLDDETPGSQGEIEAGSEGDFGASDEPHS